MGEVHSMDEVSYCSVGWTAARLARQVEVALATLDLSPAQYRMLVQIARGTDASSSLAQKLAVSAPSVTAVVDGLVQRGAVERAHSVEDRRRIALALTALRSRPARLRPKRRCRRGSRPSPASSRTGISVGERSRALTLWGEALDRARAKREAARRAERCRDADLERPHATARHERRRPGPGAPRAPLRADRRDFALLAAAGDDRPGPVQELARAGVAGDQDPQGDLVPLAR